jgi:hypothetical protein
LGYKRLYIWVEGDDDVRFFERIIKPKFVEKYNSVEVRPYAGRKKEYIDNFIKSIKAMNNDYIYVRDINDSPCVSDKKQKIQGKLKNIDKHRIIVVIQEIESWYLAGLDGESSGKLGIRLFNVTDTITKEQFNDMFSKKFASRIDFMIEILKCFSIEKAREKNRSFRYFIEKYCCEI